MRNSPMARTESRIAILTCLIVAVAPAQQPKPRATVGAYYFDGWSGKTDDMHLPKTRRLQHEAPGSPPDRPAGP